MALCTSGEILRWWIFLPEALFFRLLLCSSLETLSHAVGNPTHQVKGILGGSVLFPANVSLGITVEKTEWDFRPQRHGIDYWLGEFSHGKLEHPSPTDRFGQRLDMVDETTLRIKDLELDDGGIYNTRIWFTKSQYQEQRFSLTVYELVPTPQIHHQVKCKTPRGCNVTLRCHTPGREDLKVSWKTGVPHRALGKSVNHYQVFDNGRELRVFYWNRSFDSKFTCLVSNPVDQKRASFDLLNICQSEEGGQFGALSWGPWLIPALIALLAIMVMVMWMCWKIRLERHRRGVCSLMQEKGKSCLTVWNSERSHSEDGDDKIEPCIPQTNMGDQAHLPEPMPRNSGERATEVLALLPAEPEVQPTSRLKHWPSKSHDQAKEQDLSSDYGRGPALLFSLAFDGNSTGKKGNFKP
ncbi:SLAM family member 8-like isoform X2 [Zootoca vivipara]|uniref:SLAM family member 8-like isoform X2 n=1 Tax=Zootoca vivipara TaxID=8524 RepID=UPI00293BE11A|nr:SLAM family member 8-like isoform X2 [Zootoca vivipara]